MYYSYKYKGTMYKTECHIFTPVRDETGGMGPKIKTVSLRGLMP